MNSSNNKNYKNISKKELFNKLSKLSLKQLKDINLNVDEINYLKNKILNDKLGLVLNFEEKDEYLDNHYFGLEEVKELHINSKDKNNHLLIEGDNYYALKALQVSGIKVDVIYIDPPYNTGNKDFVYNDSFIEKDDQFKHSKWLSFMKKRLELARELLSDDGVIFVSIDDNEQAYLKVLMDEIFGEENFESFMIWQDKYTTTNDKNGISSQTDYILVYSKNTDSFVVNKLPLRKEYVEKTYRYDDNDGRGKYMTVQMFKKKNPISYDITSPNGTIWNLPWNFSKESFENLMNENRVYWGKNNNSCPRKKVYLSESKGINPINLLLGKDVGFSEDGGNEIEKLMENRKIFLYPKSTKMIKHLISIASNKKSLILDFFAGSGTTAQAVMELNEEDGGNRRFILCTNNENNIAQDICRERIYRVINGQGSKKEQITWEYSKDKKSLKNNSMKYLKVKPIHNVNGEFEEINDMKDIYKNEFDKELSVKDFK